MYYRLCNQFMCTYSLVLKCLKQFILLYKMFYILLFGLKSDHVRISIRLTGFVWDEQVFLHPGVSLASRYGTHVQS
jgi:hypothetical protein